MPHILLVEDNPHIQRIYSAKLQAEGFKVTTAENGEQGVLWAEVCEPDLLLLDIMLPKMNGFEVLERLRENPDLSRIPVFMLSNKAAADDVQHAFALGARQFFTKGSSTLQKIVTQIRHECGFKQLITITASAESSKSLSVPVQHPKLLCAVCSLLAEAVTSVEHRLPDLVVLDARPATSTAYTILQHLKTTPVTQHVPLIAITDEPQKLYRADGFVPPSRIDQDLRPVVLKLLGLSEPVEAAPPQPAGIP